jgi:8-oxo-dGTP pyrophosphatase MutT (NUDIX family)
LPRACGGVVVDGEGRVLLRRVANDFGSARWTWPKGRPDVGETPEETALREVREEVGVVASIVAPVPGEFRGTTTATSFWLMEPIEDLGSFDSETAEVRWVSPDEARELISESPSRVVRERDLAALEAALSV